MMREHNAIASVSKWLAANCSATSEKERHSQSSLPQGRRRADSAREATPLLNAARRSSSGKCAACSRIAVEQ